MTEETTPENKQTLLFKTIKTILKPLVSLMLRQGLTYTALLDVLKTTYVEVADREFTLEGKRQTDSRISVLTGVHRKEVKRIREQASTQLEPKERKAGVSAQLMALWLSDYVDESGQPMILPKVSENNEASFESLVQNVTKDVHPRSLLDEWLHQEIVIQTSSGLIQLQESGYIPAADFEEKLFFAGKNIGDHLAVVNHNLAGEKPPMFDRAVYYSNLSESSVLELERFVKQESVVLLTEVNQLAAKLQLFDVGQPNAQQHIHFGAYFLHNDVDSSEKEH